MYASEINGDLFCFVECNHLYDDNLDSHVYISEYRIFHSAVVSTSENNCIQSIQVDNLQNITSLCKWMNFINAQAIK